MARTLDVKPVIPAHAGVTEPVMKIRGHHDALERMLAMAQRHVKLGLTVSAVCVSNAENLEDVRTMTAFRDLRDTCNYHKVELILSTMIMTGGLNVGADAFAIASACKKLDLR